MSFLLYSYPYQTNYVKLIRIEGKCKNLCVFVAEPRSLIL